MGGAVLLTPGTEPHPAVGGYLTDAAGVYVYGGSAAVRDEVLTDISELLDR